MRSLIPALSFNNLILPTINKNVKVFCVLHWFSKLLKLRIKVLFKRHPHLSSYKIFCAKYNFLIINFRFKLSNSVTQMVSFNYDSPRQSFFIIKREFHRIPFLSFRLQKDDITNKEPSQDTEQGWTKHAQNSHNSCGDCHEVIGVAHFPFSRGDFSFTEISKKRNESPIPNEITTNRDKNSGKNDPKHFSFPFSFFSWWLNNIIFNFRNQVYFFIFKKSSHLPPARF